MKHLTILLAFLCACSTTPTRSLLTDSTMPPPEWVTKGSGAYEEEIGKVFYGVGTASGITDYSMQRMVSEDRARNDLAKVIEFFTGSLLKDYQSSMHSDSDKAGNELLAEKAIKTLTKATLNGVLIIDHWEHPVRNEMFSLAKLDLAKVKDSLHQYFELSHRMRKKIRERANQLHQELERETLKHEMLHKSSLACEEIVQKCSHYKNGRQYFGVMCLHSLPKKELGCYSKRAQQLVINPKHLDNAVKLIQDNPGKEIIYHH